MELTNIHNLLTTLQNNQTDYEDVYVNDIQYLVIAYVIIWLGVFLYMIYLHIKQNKLSSDIEVLEETVKTYAKKEKRRKKKKTTRK